MNWSNLKDNKCPKCNKDFSIWYAIESVNGDDQLLRHPCGFKIWTSKFSQIVNSQITKDLENKWNKEQEELFK